MKVIDLLNNIANYGEYKQEYHFKYYDRNAEEYDISLLLCEVLIHRLETGQIDLNDEVEIIEEDKKIKKLPANSSIYATDGQMTMAVLKINEIIDILNEMREDK